MTQIKTSKKLSYCVSASQKNMNILVFLFLKTGTKRVSNSLIVDLCDYTVAVVV